MVELARQYGRYGYRWIAALLRDAGWHVNDKRIERLWRREGLKVPNKQPKKGRLWLNDGSCIRLRPAYRDHVWSYDFVHHRTDDGRAFRILNIIDEYSRECLAIRVKRKLNSTDVIDALTDLFIIRGIPAYIRSDNGPEFIVHRLFKTGSMLLGPKQPTLNRGHLGRMDTVKALMPGSEMNS
jgi:transposase InsO family protein